MRGREFFWLTIFDSKRLRKHKPARRRGRHVPHAIPVIVHKNIGLRLVSVARWETPRNRLRPRNLSHRVSEAVVAADLPDERGTTGTVNRQHSLIRARGGRWQG